MNRKQIVIYIIALLLSFTFICIIALNQEPTIQQSAKCCDIDKIMTNVNNQSILSREWTKIEKELEESIGYMNVYEEYDIPTNNSFKSYMPYTSITSINSPQYKLQNQYAYTGEFGIRQVNKRFCIAIGTFSSAKIGTYVDLILENETVIRCIVGDFKSDIHTDTNNIVTLHNNCVSEFIIDSEQLVRIAMTTGNVSYCKNEWNSPVKTIKVYKKNIFDGE